MCYASNRLRLRGREVVDFGQAIRDYVRFGYCTSIGNIATFGEIFGGGGNPIGELGVQAARFLHNQFCNLPAPSPPPPPFTGGQCPTYYTIQVQWNATAIPGSGLSDESSLDTFTVIGPVQGVGIVNSSGRIFAELRAAHIPIVGGASTYRYRSVDAGFYSSATATITSVVRQDGQPDNCGSVPPVIPPYTPGSNSTTNNITYTTDNGDTVSIPTTITFGYGRVDVNGTINVPFTLNLNVTPTANITGNINLNTGDINFNAGNPTLPPSSCGGNSDDYTPDPTNLPPVSTGNPDIPDPTPDPTKPQVRKLMTGVLVTVNTVPKDVTEIFQTGNPNVLAPDAGLVAFKISVGGYVGWTEDFRVKNRRQLIPCPWKGGAIDVKGTPRSGGSFTLTPIYEKITLGAGFPA